MKLKIGLNLYRSLNPSKQIRILKINLEAAAALRKSDTLVLPRPGNRCKQSSYEIVGELTYIFKHILQMTLCLSDLFLLCVHICQTEKEREREGEENTSFFMSICFGKVRSKFCSAHTC
jgi:hypothetical protein